MMKHCVATKVIPKLLNITRYGNREGSRVGNSLGLNPKSLGRGGRRTGHQAGTAIRHVTRPTAWKEDPLAETHDAETIQLNNFKALTRRLMAADSVDGVVQIVENDRDTMNERHVAIALHRISKLCSVSTWRRSSPTSPLRIAVHWLCERLLSTSEPWPTVSISNVVMACARMRLRNVALLQRAEKEAVDETREWKVGDVLNLLHALVLTRKYMPEIVLNMAGVVEDTEGEEGESNASPGASFLAALETALLAIGGRRDVCGTADGTIEELDTSNERKLADIRLSCFSNDHLRTLSWVLYQMKCSNQLADRILLEATGRTHLSPATIGFVARLSTEQGSFDKSVSAAVTISMMVNKFLESISSGEYSSPPNSMNEDATVMVTNFGKIVRRAADMSLSAWSFNNGGGKADQGLPKWTGAIDLLKKDNYSIDSAVRDVVHWVVQFVPKTNALGLSSLAYGLAQLQVSDLTILRAVEARATELLSRSIHCRNGAEPIELRQVSTIVWSLAILKYDCPTLLEKAAVIVKRQLEAEVPFKPSVSHSKALTMILHGLAMLDRWGGEECSKLFPVLISRIELCLSYIELNALPIVGWGIVVALRSSSDSTHEAGKKGSDFDVALQVLQTWRGVVADRFSQCENEEGNGSNHKIPSQPLSMLHHVEASIRIEYPELGTGIPSTQFESFLQVLYDSGRMRGEAQTQWKGQVKHSITPSLTPSSAFQTQVYAAACELAEGWKHEYWDPELEYPIDVALPAEKVALEADGPTHFTINNLPNKRLLGATLLKRRLLSKLGWTVVSVPFYEWPGKLGVQEQVEYLSQLLKRHGVTLSASNPVLDDVTSLESKDQAPCDLTNAGSHQEPEDSHQEQARSKEELEKPENANLLLQRASRLDIVKFQKGKISRVELAKRHISRRIVTGNDNDAC